MCSIFISVCNGPNKKSSVVRIITWHIDVFQPVYLQLNEDHVPDGFLQADFWVREARYLLFASEPMLAFAKTW